MKRFALAGCLLAGSTIASSVAAQSPGLIDRPTPPPCAADGTCYPNTEAWGYYPGRWRTWPGAELVPTPATGEPTPAGQQITPELSPHETPPAELEDAQAPPASTKRHPPLAVPPVEESGAEGESAPAEMPPTAPPGGPTSDADPPPAFPLSLSTRVRSTDSSAAANGSKLKAPATTANDPPPAPPWAHRASL